MNNLYNKTSYFIVKTYTLILLTITSPMIAYACVNDRFLDQDYFPWVSRIHLNISEAQLQPFLTEQPPKEKFIEKATAEKARFNQLTWDEKAFHAGTLIKAGYVDEAIVLLKEIEKNVPNIYATASNLGTAYELQGNLDEALLWIDRGISRNPESHYGTEWLHINILKAKKALETDANYLKKHTVTGITQTEDVPYHSENTNFLPAEHTNEQIYHALMYQLKERLYFVRAPDPTVANLLCEFGDLLSIEKDFSNASTLYKMCLSYKPFNKELYKKRYEWSIANKSNGVIGYIKNNSTIPFNLLGDEQNISAKFGLKNLFIAIANIAVSVVIMNFACAILIACWLKVFRPDSEIIFSKFVVWRGLLSSLLWLSGLLIFYFNYTEHANNDAIDWVVTGSIIYLIDLAILYRMLSNDRFFEIPQPPHWSSVFLYVILTYVPIIFWLPNVL